MNYLKLLEKAVRKYGVSILFFLISLCLICIWFHTKALLAGGEEGMQFYNPFASFHLFSSVWYETGTGYPTPVFLPRAPLFLLLSLPFHFGVSAWFLQAVVYGLLLYTGLYFTYCFSKELFAEKKLVAFFAALFYLLNLYTFSQIWGRFLLTNIFAWAYLPLFLFLWLKILVANKWTLFWLLLSSFVFCFTYGMPAMLLVLWVPALVLIAKHMASAKKLAKLLQMFFFTGGIVIGWILVNSWWLYPYSRLTTVSFSKVASFKENFDSLVSVSQYFPTSQIFLLRQSFLFGKESAWGIFYNNPLIILLSILVLCATIVGLVSSRKERYWKTLCIIFFIGWFISKGTNPPFGFGFFYVLFSHFSFSQVLRNSYEKFGLVFVLPYALFFGYGLYWIIHTIRGNAKYLAYFLILLFFCGILVWPYWTGAIFKSESIFIPLYYKQADMFLQENKSDGRILSLPFLPGDSVKYIFPDSSYQGVDASDSLFARESVSKILRANYFDDYYKQTYKTFTSGQDYTEYLDNMNIRYIVLHKDMESASLGASTSGQVIGTLRNNQSIQLIKDIGKLSLYEYKGISQKGLFKIQGKSQQVYYHKLDQTHFQVYITQEEKPYELIFLNTYSLFWMARIGKETVQTHTIYSGFANKWHITKKGTYTIDIVFAIWPWER